METKDKGSGNKAVAAFLHAAHNNYDQAVFGVITAGANKMIFVSETGVLTILCAWIVAGILYRRARSESASNRQEREAIMEQVFTGETEEKPRRLP